MMEVRLKNLQRYRDRTGIHDEEVKWSEEQQSLEDSLDKITFDPASSTQHMISSLAEDTSSKVKALHGVNYLEPIKENLEEN